MTRIPVCVGVDDIWKLKNGKNKVLGNIVCVDDIIASYRLLLFSLFIIC